MTMLKQAEIEAAALPVEDLRAHLRLGTGFGDESLQDAVLESFLRAALATVEAQTAKVLLTRAMVLTLGDWRDGASQTLPVGPVLRIDAVRFVLSDGDTVELGPDAWWLRSDDALPALVSRRAALPTPPPRASIEIAFHAGYGTWTDVPADLRQAVMLLAAHYYENRSATQLNAGCMPFGVTALIEPYRLRRIGFGGRA